MIDLLRNLRFDRASVFISSNYWFGLPVIFLISVLLAANLANPKETASVALANVLALLVSAVMFYFGRALIRKAPSNKPIRYATIAFFGSVVGFTKGFITGLTLAVMVPEQGLIDSVISRALPTTFIGAWLFLTVEIVVTLRQQFANNRDQLIRKKVQSLLQDDAPNHNLSAELRAFVVKSRMFLDGLRQDESANLDAAAATIRNEMAEVLRPISHRLWDQQSSIYPRYRFIELYRFALKTNPFAAEYLVPVYAISAIGQATTTYGVARGLATLALTSVALYLGLAILRSIRLKSAPATSLRFYIGVAFAVAVTTVPLASDSWASVLGVNLVWLPILILASALISTAIKANAGVESELRQLHQGEHSSQNAASLRTGLANRELAKHLHGNVQNRLLSAAMRLEAYEGVNKRQALFSELALVEEILQNLETPSQPAQVHKILQAAQLAQQNWMGVLEVSVVVAVEVCDESLGPNRDHQLFESINEALANAFRHGGATQAKVSVTQGPSGVIVEVSDNGTGSSSNSSGLGSAVFSQLAGSSWRLENQPGSGAILRLNVSRTAN